MPSPWTIWTAPTASALMSVRSVTAFLLAFAAGGDFNGDGIDDFALSGRRIFTPDGGDTPGEAIIVFGSNPAPAFDLNEDATDIADATFTGLSDDSGFGR